MLQNCRALIIFSILFLSHINLFSQQKIGEKWIDNNLQISVQKEAVKTLGYLTFCIMDTTENFCVENLQTGLEVHVYNEKDEKIYAGKTTGRIPDLKFPEPMPAAHYVVLKAFKPWVTNKLTGTRIHQDEPLELKYFLK